MVPLPQRRALLVAALGFMRLRWREPVPPAVVMLARWMNTWSGVGAVARGMTAQSFNLELKEFPHGWRANFYPVGMAHSVVLGSAYEPTAWAAVQKAAWAALQEPWSSTSTGRRRPGAISFRVVIVPSRQVCRRGERSGHL